MDHGFTRQCARVSENNIRLLVQFCGKILLALISIKSHAGIQGKRSTRRSRESGNQIHLSRYTTTSYSSSQLCSQVHLRHVGEQQIKGHEVGEQSQKASNLEEYRSGR